MLFKIKSLQKTTFSPNKNFPKSVLQDHYILPKWKLLKISPFKTTQPPKVKIIQNHPFQDHYNLPKWKLTQISPFCPQHSSKVKGIHNKSFQDHDILQKWKWPKTVLLRLMHPPKVNLSIISLSCPLHPPNMNCPNQCFQYHLILASENDQQYHHLIVYLKDQYKNNK